MEMYALFIDIHDDSYTYYKKSEVDLAFKNLEEGNPAILRQYNAVDHEVSFEKECTTDRYLRKFKSLNWLTIEDVKEFVQVALEDRQSLLNGDFS
ncbi:hypothetical protein ACT4ZY_06920 [Acinetobacter baumannii]|uniref:hypothetical protein n=1 Tax=Acinetobacter baumannii TaxID=470 RepID=UPI0018AF7036|nr:hypothetical protein [Acinetobacter baumannii]MBF9225241.1 hypothetical protein [Acinetobacter baumannii]MCJ9137000.1 hypothetical protein [Acinetobacter baumannii]MCJ9279871.1 hypothetical protein [Acinetobacter baumannii]MCJ9451978.1 hypothetical protein [Acinetobacter baumannii]MCJ9484505.1 hypothetical protein [Acinetobacter baumannii]